jgi:5'-3' exonuclease
MQTFLIDASIFIFRAWFTMPDDMVDADDNPVNALYGYTRFLGDFLERVQPEYVAAAFDVSLTSSFRNDLYPDYKANRDPAPPELKRQFQLCREVTRALGVRECADSSYEADDLIGTLAVGVRRAGHTVTIVSRDKDLLQLLEDGDRFWDYAGQKTIAHHQVSDAFGVRAEQMPDYLGLAGDSVDNIPGVPGVGAKTAAGLLQKFHDLEDIYANLEQVAALPLRGASKLGARLAEHRDRAELCRELARIRCDAPMDVSEASVQRQPPVMDEITRFYDAAGFGTSLRRQAERIADQY